MVCSAPVVRIVSSHATYAPCIKARTNGLYGTIHLGPHSVVGPTAIMPTIVFGTLDSGGATIRHSSIHRYIVPPG